MKVLVLVDLVVIAVAVAIWVAYGRGDDRENAVNPGLRGSKPPQGQTTLDLSAISGIEPAVPKPATWHGAPVMLVTTCLDCQSGDLVGGFLRLLEARDLPEAKIVVAGWDGDADAWRTRWQLTDDIELHVAATDAAAATLQGAARVGDTGFAYLSDTEGQWRSTYTASTLKVEDVVHDLEALR